MLSYLANSEHVSSSSNSEETLPMSTLASRRYEERDQIKKLRKRKEQNLRKQKKMILEELLNLVEHPMK